MKPCDICGTLNFKENNYCVHCGNKLIQYHVCPVCGAINDANAKYCSNCQSQLNPISIDDFDILFNEFNQKLLENASISDEEYSELLYNIFAKAKYADINGETIKDKILSFANLFTDYEPKSRGYERGFIFLGNRIYYDDRLNESVQIATIIHELAHYFLFNIVENLLCNIFKVNSSSTIQSFVWYFMTLPEFKIMNEYCAHTVEGRFIPHGYQNYGSFNNLLESTDFDSETIETMVVMGNSFANEIIVYMEKYIDGDFRDEIKLQYKKDLISPNYQSILSETDQCFSVSLKNKFLLSVLYDVFIEALNKDARKELESIKEGIEVG